MKACLWLCACRGTLYTGQEGAGLLSKVGQEEGEDEDVATERVKAQGTQLSSVTGTLFFKRFCF